LKEGLFEESDNKIILYLIKMGERKQIYLKQMPAVNICSLVRKVCSLVAAGLPYLPNVAVTNEPLKLIKFDMRIVSMPTDILIFFILIRQ
jgi:hypothetical protein